MRKISFWIVVGVTLFLGIPIAVLSLFMSMAPAWPEPVPGVRLTPSAPILKAADITESNGVFHVLAIEGIQSSYTNWPRGSDLQPFYQGAAPNTMTNMLAAMTGPRTAFEQVHQAAACAFWQVETATNAHLSSTWETGLIQLSNLAGFEANHLAEQGRWDEAEVLLADHLILGSRLRRGGGSYSRLIAVAINATTIGHMIRLCASNEVPEKTLAAWSEVLWQEADNMEPSAETVRYELLMADNLIEQYLYGPKGFVGGRFESLAAFLISLPKWTLRPMGSSKATTLDHFRAAASWDIHRFESAYDPELNTWDDFFYQQHSNKRFLLGSDPLGRIGIDEAWPLLIKLDRDARRELNQMRGAAALMGIERARRATGQLPASLEELVPTYLPAVPPDLFQPGSNLIYRVRGENLRLYSVGEDQIDHKWTPLPASRHDQRHKEMIWPLAPLK